MEPEDDIPEPVERLEEIPYHPCDKTFNNLHDKQLAAKKELTEERHQLAHLMAKLPPISPKKGEIGYEEYGQILQQIQLLKQKISKKHDDLMEILKHEEKIIREIQENNP